MHPQRVSRRPQPLSRLADVAADESAADVAAAEPVAETVPATDEA